MKSRFLSFVAAVLLGGLLLGACDKPSSVFFDPNAPSSVGYEQVDPGLLFQNTLTIFGSPQVAPPGTLRTFHVSVYTSQFGSGQPSGPTGVSSVNVSYQGSQIGSVALDANQPSAGGTMQWMPPSAPGEYVLQAVTNEGAVSATTSICVVDLGVTVDYLEVMNGTTCLPPAASASSAAFSILHANAIASIEGCSTVNVEFDIYVDDPSNQIAYAYVDLANVTDGVGEHTFGLPGPRSVYGIAWSLPLDSLMNQLGGSTAITWTARVVSLSGKILSDGPHQLTITVNCIGEPNGNVKEAPQFQRFAPDQFPLQWLTATPTPASANDCPAGTYFAPVTSRCINIQIKTPKPGNDNEAGQCPPGQTLVCTGMMAGSCSCK